MGEKSVVFFYKDKKVAEALMNVIPQIGQIIDLNIETENDYKGECGLRVVRVESFIEIYLDKSCDDSYCCYLERENKYENI